MLSRLGSAIVATVLLTGAAVAQAPTEIGTFSDWSAYSATTPTGKVCFAVSQPKSRRPDGLNRDPAYFFISTRPAESVRNQVSVIMGFPLRKDGEVSIAVNGSPFTAYSRDDGAWIRETTDEARLVDAMRKGRDLVVKGASQRGNVTTDTYSLSGISAALDKAGEVCK